MRPGDALTTKAIVSIWSTPPGKHTRQRRLGAVRPGSVGLIVGEVSNSFLVVVGGWVGWLDNTEALRPILTVDADRSPAA